VLDPYENYFQIVEYPQSYKENNFIFGGDCGAVSGVSDMDIAIDFYSNAFGVCQKIYEVISKERVFEKK